VPRSLPSTAVPVTVDCRLQRCADGSHALVDQRATPGTIIGFTIAAATYNDVGVATLGYTANLEDGSALPIWLTFDASTRSFNGTPTSADLCTLTMIEMATDQAGASERHICVDVGAWQLFLLPLFATQ
jgi:hypothetical protein